MQRVNAEVSEITNQDLKDIAEIEKKLFGDAWSEKMFAEHLEYNPQSVNLKAKVDGKIAAYIVTSGMFETLDIDIVATDRDFQKQGLAQVLIDELTARTPDTDIYMLEVRESNIPAISLYLKNGFEKVTVRKNYYTKPSENAIIMSKKRKRGC